MPHLLLAGAPTGCWTNLGDEAILAGMVAALRETIDDATFTVVTSSPPETYDPYGCDSVRFDDLPALATAVAECDMVVIGGGSIFFDYWKCNAADVLTPRHQGISLWTGLVLLAAAREIPVMTYDVGLGPLRTDAGTLMARTVFDLAAVNTVRDSGSRELALSWRPAGVGAAAGVDEAGFVRTTGDPAIAVDLPVDVTLPGSTPPGMTPPGMTPPADGTHPPERDSVPVLGVALRQWQTDDPDAWSAAVARAIDTHLDATGGRAVFIACHRKVRWPLTDDEAAANDVIAHMTHADRTSVVTVDTPWAERAAMLGRCDAVLAMRYHGALFALRAGVPTVGLSYDPKVAGLFADWGAAGHCLELDTAGADPDRVAALLSTPAPAATLRTGAGRMLRREHRAAVLAAGLVTGDRRPGRASGIPVAARRGLATLLERMADSADRRPPTVAAALDRLRERLGLPPIRRPSVAILTNRLLDRATGEVRIGGAERYALDLARLLHDLGLAPEFYQGGGDFEVGDFYGFPVHPLPFGQEVSEFQIGVGEQFYERTRDADHVLYLMPNYAAGPMRDDAVVISHGVWWDHDLWPHLQLRSDEWLEQMRRVFTRPARVISVDANTGNVVRALFPAVDERIRHIPSAVDTSAFAPPADRFDTGARADGPPLVIFPRRAETIRGAHLVGPILDRVPGPCRFSWIGGGNKKQVARLREIARRDDRLTLDEAGFDEMPARYAAADICVIPTVASEGQSLSCLEAMASGLAVVVTRVGGLPELVTNEVDGLVCDPEPESLAAAIRRLARDPGLRDRLGAAARRTALRHSSRQWRADWAAQIEDLGWVRDVAARAVPYDVINFSIINYDQRYQRPQQLAVHWGRRGRRVFYVRSWGHAPADGRPFEVSEVAPGVFDVRLALPADTSLHYAKYPDGFLDAAMTSLAALRDEWHIDAAVSMAELGTWLPVVAAARERFGWPVLYDCMDNWSTFPGFAKRPRVLEAERDLVRTADVMAVSGRTIQQHWSADRPDALLARNAADFEFFHAAADRGGAGTSADAPVDAPADAPTDVPADIAHLTGPIAGFCGGVVEWFDVELVRRVATDRPDVQFVFVGGIARVSLAPLDGLANVHFLGHREYRDMPRYLRAFDVCLVPFVANETTASMDLVKIYEYLATGKPVVCTPVAEMVQYGGLLHLADGPDEFLAQLDAALAEDDPAARDRRIAMARLNSWHDRIDVIERALLPVFAGGAVTLVAGDEPGSAATAPMREHDLARSLAAAAERTAAAEKKLATLTGSRSMQVIHRYWKARETVRGAGARGRRHAGRAYRALRARVRR